MLSARGASRCSPAQSIAKSKLTGAFDSGVQRANRATAGHAIWGSFTLADGETVHNAFFDRGFREDET